MNRGKYFEDITILVFSFVLALTVIGIAVLWDICTFTFNKWITLYNWRWLNLKKLFIPLFIYILASLLALAIPASDG